MDLFSIQNNANLQPLAEQLRPKNLDEFWGQEQSIGAKSKLGQLIRSGFIPNMILWGPPGTGKTTFALILSDLTNSRFISENAVSCGVKTLREIGENGHRLRLENSQKTILFIDEIHRFSKSQQDVLLPYVEKGDVILIGATTENPGYEINKALLSRARIVPFKRLDIADLRKVISTFELKFKFSIQNSLSEEAWNYLFSCADGDARRLINSLELVYKYLLLNTQSKTDSSHIDQNKEKLLNLTDLEELLPQSYINYDKNTDNHYNIVSAFIKSIRGSDPDAAIYYLARMLKGGEDPLYIARRLLILASEDVGNAEPRALQVALDGFKSVEVIGMPESEIILAQVATFLACSPKSNSSYVAIKKAKEFVDQTGSLDVPWMLQSHNLKGHPDLIKNKVGKEYLYPHDFPKKWVKQSYLPKEIEQKTFFQLTQSGYEKKLNEFLIWLKS